MASVSAEILVVIKFLLSFFEIDQATNYMKFQLVIGVVEAAIRFQNGETFHVADNPFYFGANHKF